MSRLHGESISICRGGAVGIEVRDQIMEMLDPGLDPINMGSNGRLAGGAGRLSRIDGRIHIR